MSDGTETVDLYKLRDHLENELRCVKNAIERCSHDFAHVPPSKFEGRSGKWVN